MDRRVFQPRPDGSAERRRNALSLAVLILVAGWLWLSYSKSHPAAVQTTPPAAHSAPKN